jgi:hypothetical protein
VSEQLTCAMCGRDTAQQDKNWIHCSECGYMRHADCNGLVLPELFASKMAGLQDKSKKSPPTNNPGT